MHTPLFRAELFEIGGTKYPYTHIRRHESTGVGAEGRKLQELLFTQDSHLLQPGVCTRFLTTFPRVAAPGEWPIRSGTTRLCDTAIYIVRPPAGNSIGHIRNPCFRPLVLQLFTLKLSQHGQGGCSVRPYCSVCSVFEVWVMGRPRPAHEAGHALQAVGSRGTVPAQAFSSGASKRQNRAKSLRRLPGGVSV